MTFFVEVTREGRRENEESVGLYAVATNLRCYSIFHPRTIAVHLMSIFFLSMILQVIQNVYYKEIKTIKA